MSCKKCGACCMSFIIEVEHADVVREPKLEKAVRLLDGNGEFKYRDDFDKVYSLCDVSPCPMLRKNNTCSIYKTRPRVCVCFQPGGAKCKEAQRVLALKKGVQPVIKQCFGIDILKPEKRNESSKKGRI